MFNRPTFYTVLGIGLIGTFFIWQMGRLPLVLGWWCGIGIGILNFSFLLSSLRKSQAEKSQAEQKTKIPRQPFFFRYVILAVAFFVVLQLGSDQFGSALAGFGAYYISVLIQYVIQFKKQKGK